MTRNKNSTRYYSGKQERKIAKQLNGKLTSNSGAARFSAGDVNTELFLIEDKTCMTDKQSFSIKEEWIDKNKEEAFAMNKPYSAIAFNFGPNSENYYVIDERLFKTLNDYLKGEKE